MNFKNFVKRKKIINRNIKIEKGKKEKLRIKKNIKEREEEKLKKHPK